MCARNSKRSSEIHKLNVLPKWCVWTIILVARLSLTQNLQLPLDWTIPYRGPLWNTLLSIFIIPSSNWWVHNCIHFSTSFIVHYFVFLARTRLLWTRIRHPLPFSSDHSTLYNQYSFYMKLFNLLHQNIIFSSQLLYEAKKDTISPNRVVSESASPALNHYGYGRETEGAAIRRSSSPREARWWETTWWTKSCELPHPPHQPLTPYVFYEVYLESKVRFLIIF